MSRFHEDDGDNPVAIMWEANMERIYRGKRGQKLLREFIDALLALPERRLVANAICKNGEVCAVGAMAKHRGLLDTSEDWEGDDYETMGLGKKMGLGVMLAWQMGAENDIYCQRIGLRQAYVTLDVPVEVPRRWRGDGRPEYDRRVLVHTKLYGFSPEERWKHLYDWAASKIAWNLPAPVNA